MEAHGTLAATCDKRDEELPPNAGLKLPLTTMIRHSSDHLPGLEWATRGMYS